MSTPGLPIVDRGSHDFLNWCFIIIEWMDSPAFRCETRPFGNCWVTTGAWGSCRHSKQCMLSYNWEWLINVDLIFVGEGSMWMTIHHTNSCTLSEWSNSAEDGSVSGGPSRRVWHTATVHPTWWFKHPTNRERGWGRGRDKHTTARNKHSTHWGEEHG